MIKHQMQQEMDEMLMQTLVDQSGAQVIAAPITGNKPMIMMNITQTTMTSLVINMLPEEHASM